MGKLGDFLSRFRIRYLRKSGQKIRVAFLVHNVSTLDCFIPLMKEMGGDKRFEVLTASLNKKFPGDTVYAGEEIVHKELKRLAIEHIRLGMQDSMKGREILKAMKPDIIFRQSPWDDDIQEGFRTRNLLFCYLCYTPYYGIHIVDNGEKDRLHIDQPFHRHCWRIFVDSATASEYYEKSKLHGKNVVVTGLPKYEYLWRYMKDNRREKKQAVDFEKYIIWAPHHSVDKDWFNFATFHKIYRFMLDYVEGRPYYHFVFRPHPAFYNNYVSSGVLAKKEMDLFYDKWNSLNNTSISDNKDYADVFLKSDAMITDGISFLASYQITGKPLIWTKNEGCQEFTELGKKMAESLYIIKDSEITKIGKLLDKLFTDSSNDYLKRKRSVFINEYLLNKNMGSASEIVKEILKGIGK